MIIKLTAGSRKMASKLAAFAKVLHLCEKNYKQIPVPETLKMYDENEYETLKKRIVLNTADAGQQYDFCRIIRSRFEYYCQKSPFVSFTDEEIAYLTKNINIDITATLTHHDENGESVYVFLDKDNDTNQIIIL